MNRRIFAVLIAAAASGAAPGVASGQSLTVYSSLPLSGAARTQTKAVNEGARLALQEAGGMAGGRSVRLVTLNDASKRAGSWVPELVSRNARRAANDDSSVGFIGAFNSGASAIAIPITNDAGIPMISPSNTANGLTTDGPGTEPGEPDKYYPTGIRSYFRLLPNDAVQAAALATAMRDRGCKAIAVLTDGTVYGAGAGTIVRQTARRLGVGVVKAVRIDRRAPNYRALARSIRKVDCVVYTGITANGAVRLFKDVGRALRKAQLFASDGVAETGFTRPLPASVARRVTVTVATLGPDAYPAAGQTVIARTGDPYGVYGYEAMKLILDGLNAVGPDKPALMNWLHTVQGRDSAIGSYGFDANGDTTLRTYGLYTIRGKSLRWAGAVTAA